ncbi:MAG: Ig-like domain-containing protein, partial [Terriglobales bacterium]
MVSTFSISITHIRRSRNFAAVLALSLGVLVLFGAPVQAQYTPSVLYSFAGGTADGGSPHGLLFDSKGNLYGTTETGGANGNGIAYELSPPTSGSGPWTETILYNFCSTGGTQCSDGVGPSGPLVFDSKGNLYGTASGGGNDTYGGVAFELSPDGSGGWTEKVLYSFCVSMTSPCADGAGPSGGLIFDSKGNLYGNAGDGAYSQGVVFELSPPSSGSGAWTEKVLYSFCPAGLPCTDGAGPSAGLVFDSKGDLYGTTSQGGANQGACNLGGAIGCGVVFEVSGSGETVLHSFAGPDGSHSYGTLVFDSQGNLYGTTQYGGTTFSNSGDTEGYGVVFELSPPAGSGSWTVNVLHSFCNAGTASYCTDGNGPLAGLILDSNGNLYGTTLGGGGLDAYGVAFEVSPPASGTGAWTESVLYAFSSPATIGAYPTSDLIFDAKGNLYGAAGSSGSRGGGTVFELVSDLIATTTSLATSPNPSSQGQSVTMTATVKAVSGPTPGGTVKFASDGAVIGTATLNGSGVAVLDYAGLALGTFSISAVYESSTTYAGSTSNAVSQVVTLPSSTTTVTSSLDPSMVGQSVTLTATVTPAGPPTPTGTVDFTSLGTTISGCSEVELSSSRTATCTTSTLPVGTDAIVASYSGDSNYLSSMGTLAQLVNP